MSRQIAGPKLVTIERRKPSGPQHTIYQEQLRDVICWRQALRASARELQEFEREIASALRCGAQVEPGEHTVELLRVTITRPYPAFYFKLAFRTQRGVSGMGLVRAKNPSPRVD